MGSREEGPARKSEQEPGSAAHSSSPGLARVSYRVSGIPSPDEKDGDLWSPHDSTIPQSHAESVDACGCSA